MKRGRNQRRRQGGGSNPNRALDSNGPDVRIRGTATQIYDKYQALARDAASSGDRVKAESYLQHAEHYFRVIRSMQPAQAPNQQANQDSDSEQPTIDDGEQDNRDARQQNGQRQQRTADADMEKGDDSSSAGEATAAAPEEERKPRRRRAPRRAAKADNDAESDEATPAAAE